MRLLSLLLAGCFLSSTSCAAAHAATRRHDPTPVFSEKGRLSIGDITAEALAPVLGSFLAHVQAGEPRVLFEIDSFGGSVFTGLDFIQIVTEVKRQTGVKVDCVVDSRAMSMGFVILQSDVCDTRSMTKRSVLLAHGAATTVQGAKEKELLSNLEMVHALTVALSSVCADRMHMNLDVFLAKIDGIDWTMEWREALNVHAVDAVVSPADLPPLFLE